MSFTQGLADWIGNNNVGANSWIFVLILLFIILLLLVLYLVYYLGFKDRARAYNLGMDNSVSISYHRVKLKTVGDSSDKKYEARIFRPLRGALVIKAYTSRHKQPVHGKKGYDVEFLVKNGVFSPLIPVLDMEKAEKQVQIDADVSNWMADQVIASDKLTESRSAYEKYKETIHLAMLALVVIVIFFFAADLYKTIIERAPECRSATVEPDAGAGNEAEPPADEGGIGSLIKLQYQHGDLWQQNAGREPPLYFF